MSMKTWIRTTLGDELILPLEVGAKIDQAIIQGAVHVRINPKTNQFLKVSTIALKEDRYIPDPIKDTTRLLPKPEHKRADLDSPGYKKYIALKRKMLRKKDNEA